MKNKLTKYVIKKTHPGRDPWNSYNCSDVVLIPVYLLEGKECDESFVYSG